MSENIKVTMQTNISFIQVDAPNICNHESTMRGELP